MRLFCFPNLNLKESWNLVESNSLHFFFFYPSIQAYLPVFLLSLYCIPIPAINIWINERAEVKGKGNFSVNTEVRIDGSSMTWFDRYTKPTHFCRLFRACPHLFEESLTSSPSDRTKCTSASAGPSVFITKNPQTLCGFLVKAYVSFQNGF